MVSYLAAAIYVFGMVFYATFASGEKQPWAERGEHDLTNTDEVELVKNDRTADENSKEKSQ